ncbi:hypothetical protein CDIK_1803 [Cucumispora dikerogammari]|nr:hypothetical protein CDIK_1803 [Cucumispora dikerogammari]
MLTEIISYFSRFFSADTDYNTTIRKKSPLELFNTLRDRTLEIHNECKQMQNEFDSKFDQIIKEVFPKPRMVWTISEEYIEKLEREDWQLYAQSQEFLGIKNRMRMLFFTSFISFYYSFFSKMNMMITKEEEQGSYNKFYLHAVFNGLDPSEKYAKFNEINIKFLKKSKSPDITFLYLIKRLEKKVALHTGNLIKNIRKVLYLNHEFKFDTDNDKSIQSFYFLVNHFLNYYNSDYKLINKTEMFCRIPFFDRKIMLNPDAVFKTLNKHYQEYLKVDIESRYKASHEYINDLRFATYNKYRDVLHKCCLVENKSFLKNSCEKHQEILDSIRLEYYGINPANFFIKTSVFNYRLVRIEEMYRKLYDK